MPAKFKWEKVEDTPDSLPLYRLSPVMDVTRAAVLTSCGQDIAGKATYYHLKGVKGMRERHKRGLAAVTHIKWFCSLLIKKNQKINKMPHQNNILINNSKCASFVSDSDCPPFFCPFWVFVICTYFFCSLSVYFLCQIFMSIFLMQVCFVYAFHQKFFFAYLCYISNILQMYIIYYILYACLWHVYFFSLSYNN